MGLTDVCLCYLGRLNSHHSQQRTDAPSGRCGMSANRRTVKTKKIILKIDQHECLVHFPLWQQKQAFDLNYISMKVCKCMEASHFQDSPMAHKWNNLGLNQECCEKKIKVPQTTAQKNDLSKICEIIVVGKLLCSCQMDISGFWGIRLLFTVLLFSNLDTY